MSTSLASICDNHTVSHLLKFAISLVPNSVHECFSITPNFQGFFLNQGTVVGHHLPPERECRTAVSSMVGSHQGHGARWGPGSQYILMVDLVHLLMNQENSSQASVSPRTLTWYLGKACMISTIKRAELTKSWPGSGHHCHGNPD